MSLVDKLRAHLKGAAREAAAERLKRVIREYIETSSKHAQRTMVDERELTHPKAMIRAALIEHMKEKPEFRSMVVPLYLRTAIYQRDVADRDAMELLDAVASDMKTLEAELKARGLG
jgi:hypothetical protein